MNRTHMRNSVVTLLIGLLVTSAFAQNTPGHVDPLGPGDHTRTIMMGEQKRTYLVHVPKKYDPKSPTPVILALHGAAMDGSMMVWFSGLNKKSDEAGFIVVYPSGTGVGPFHTWNAGGFSGKMAEGKADDVAFIGKLLDDLVGVVKVDEKRVYACGMSNGGMMCYRLAAELSDRIAAVAPVAGTIAIEESKPKRPVPVIHFHGSQDNIVPFEMKKEKTPPFMKKWITRERVKVDRVACPWLIRKFIDRQAEFLFVPADQVMLVAEREGAIPYDVPNVEFGHHGLECSFDRCSGEEARADN